VDALLTSLVAAALAEMGDKTQLFVLALAIRFGKSGPILLGIAVAALLNSFIAAAGGSLIHDLIAPRALSLLVALALIFAGVAGFIRAKPPRIADKWSTGPFLTAAFGFFILEFGDKTQFTTGALAARYDSILLAALGAVAGIFAANMPAVVLGKDYLSYRALGWLRRAIATLFLLTGFWVALQALRLV
jgi:putative Ca2+/H+ antiporter (TMEM165/GDT1 family)